MQRSEARSGAAWLGWIAAWAALALFVELHATRLVATAEPAAPTAGAARAPTLASAALSASQLAELEAAKFVYISSTRKDGSLSEPAEIWFMVADGSIWVASPPTTWRVKRIRWGRPMATIWIGRRDGPSLRARGEIVRDEKRYDKLCARFAVKYPDRWPRWESSFREGLRSGERVLIRYAPVAN